jgi:TetR/AcrR family transcriptional repressor of mexJK operon
MSDPAVLPEAGTSPKRRAIREAAAELFMAEGFGAVSMDAVARAAQVSKATLYAHFSGKEALFTDIIESHCTQMQAMMEGALPTRSPALEDALAELGRRWLEFLLLPRVRALHRVVISEGVRFPHLARGFYEAGPQTVRRWLASWMARQQQAGRLRPDADPRLVADQFLALLRSDTFLRAVLGLPPEQPGGDVREAAAEAARAVARLYGAAVSPTANTAPDKAPD